MSVVSVLISRRLWAHRWINHWSFWRVASAMPDLQLLFQLQGITAPSPYQIILLDDRDICVWTTCIEKTLKYSNCLYFRILLLEILLYACLVIGCRVYVVENSCYCSGKQWVVQGSCIQHYQCDTSECLLSSINFFIIHFVNYYSTK